MGYSITNQQRRKYERQENKTGISSWGREARRDQEEGHPVSTGPNHGNSSSSPRVYHPGPEVHRNRIPGYLKSSYERNGRTCLELITLPARASRANHPHRKGSVQASERPSKQARIADQSSSAQARERTSESPDSVTAELS